MDKVWEIDWSMVNISLDEAPDEDHDIASYDGYAMVNGKKVEAWGDDENDGFQLDIAANIVSEAAKILGCDEHDECLNEIMDIGPDDRWSKTTITLKDGKVTIKNT